MVTNGWGVGSWGILSDKWWKLSEEWWMKKKKKKKKTAPKPSLDALETINTKLILDQSISIQE